jgi:D-tyrosyl-tRNA(Tyr) deacylase
MRVVVQRVSQAQVRVADEIVGAIGAGLVALVGIAPGDTPDAVAALAYKIARLRVFPDDQGKMNRSVLDLGAAVLVVSQFTLLGDIRKGTRPNFHGAAPPDVAAPLIKHFVVTLRSMGLNVAEGRFGAHMVLSLVNDGPVTLVLDG